MMPLLTSIKDRLRHVHAKAWHVRLATEVWGDTNIEQSHACTYYWFKIPLSILLLIIYMAVMGVISCAMLFCGYVPVWVNQTAAERRDVQRQSFGYKKLPNGMTLPVAPWQIAILVAVALLVYDLVVIEPETGLSLAIFLLDLAIFVLGIVGVIAIIGIIFFLLFMGWKTRGFQKRWHVLTNWWNKVCPPLVVKKD